MLNTPLYWREKIQSCPPAADVCWMILLLEETASLNWETAVGTKSRKRSANGNPEVRTKHHLYANLSCELKNECTYAIEYILQGKHINPL